MILGLVFFCFCWFGPQMLSVKGNYVLMKDLDTIFKKAQSKKILVVGDVMLDEYSYGSVNRHITRSTYPCLKN